MTRLLIGKECLALVRDGRLLALGLAVLFISVAVLATSHAERARRHVEKQELEHDTRGQWDQQGEKHPHRGAHFGLYVFAPETVLSAFDPGVQRYLGQTIWLEPHRRNLPRLSDASENPMLSRFGEFTAAFVLSAIVPLLAFAASYASIAGERETGTLRMVRGTGKRLPSLLGSKSVALLGVVGGIVILPFAAMAMISGEVIRTLLLSGSYLVHCAIFLALGLTVSALSRTSRQALITLIAIWLLLVWVIPLVASSIASRSVELPLAERFWSDIRRDYENGLPGDGDLAARSQRFDAELLAKHGVARLEDLPFGAYAVRRLNRDVYADRVHELHFNDLWDRFAEQEQLLRYGSLFSPVIATRLISMKLSGTDLGHRRSFEEAAEQYRRYFNTHIDQWDTANSVGLRSFEERYANDEVWKSVRRFEYEAPGTKHVLSSIVPELGVNVGWLFVSWGLLVLVVHRVRA